MSALLVLLVAASVLCLIGFVRVNVISSSLGATSASTINAPLSQETDTEQQEVRRRLTEVSSPNPFMDGVCMDFLQDSMLQITVPTFSVVIIARNEERSALLRTVKSVLANSANPASAVGVSDKVILKNIIIVDDFSYPHISDWEEWAELKSADTRAASLLKILRLNRHSGTAFAKNHAVEEVKKSAPGADHGVVFLDAHAVVSPFWLLPLASTLSRYPKALVYPILDVLTTSTNAAGAEEVGVVRADDHLVAAFDWALRPRWERLLSHTAKQQQNQPVADRVKTVPHATSPGVVEVLSPAAPGIFAVRLQFLTELGHFDAAQYGSYASSAETVELSLRAWLCGGMVIKQSCSRVAHQSANLFSDAPVGHGVTQGAVDRAVLNVAQKWLQGTATLPTDYKGESVTYQEVAFRARFLHRVPYGVETANDPILVTPPQSTIHTITGVVKATTDVESHLHVCLPFQWYLHEVYPGLLADAPGVLERFAEYVSSDYMQQQKPLQQLVQEYNKPVDQQQTHVMQTGLLSVRAGKLERLAAATIGAGKPIKTEDHFLIKRQFTEPPGPKAPTRAELLMEHTRQVEKSLVCEDFPEKVYANSCEAKLASDPELCTLRKAEILFQCPKTCNYCAKEDGQFCEDFYLNKCVKWHADGRCGENDREYGPISDVCRKSCSVCTPGYSSEPAKSANAGAAAAAAGGGGTGGKPAKPIVLNVKKPEPHKIVQSNDPNLPPPPKIPEFSEKEIEMMKIDAMINGPMSVNPDYLHSLYVSGQVPDYLNGEEQVVTANTLCEPMERADAQLLSHVTLASNTDRDLSVDAEGKPLRIFCGIYTMESNHGTNVKATRNTWAKKCDGFIAFSTKDDPLIPSVSILHEGKEAYDNMWQKSRSIWKYVYAHLRDKYDFFLLGGDDMFYIVENLRAYLGSEEITNLRNERDGLFIGRIFQPPNQIVFNSGGAGYMLDTKALTVLGKNIDSPKCFPHQTGFWEDVNVANCLKKSTPSIVPYDTRDPQLRERFHPFTPGLQLTYRIPPNTPDWYAKYNPELKTGFDCCSDESISFHYVKEKLLYKLYNYVYHCDNKLTN